LVSAVLPVLLAIKPVDAQGYHPIVCGGLPISAIHFPLVMLGTACWTITRTLRVRALSPISTFLLFKAKTLVNSKHVVGLAVPYPQFIVCPRYLSIPFFAA
jgi:hypothetical protein